MGPREVPETFDIRAMLITFSPILVEGLAHVLSECLAVLKSRGMLLFRDTVYMI